MVKREDDGFDYRSPVSVGPSTVQSPQDEQDFSTLVIIRAELDQAILGLYTDFNALTIADKEKLHAQVAGRQVAYDILTPLRDRINSIVDGIKNNEGDV